MISFWIWTLVLYLVYKNLNLLKAIIVTVMDYPYWFDNYYDEYKLSITVCSNFISAKELSVYLWHKFENVRRFF